MFTCISWGGEVLKVLNFDIYIAPVKVKTIKVTQLKTLKPDVYTCTDDRWKPRLGYVKNQAACQHIMKIHVGMDGFI